MMIMKNIPQKITALLLCLTFVFALLPITASAKTSGDYRYTINDDGSATITKYTGSGTDVTIPSTVDNRTVTMIGERAFENSENLTSVTIPNGVIMIESYVFDFCLNLKTVNIPNSVTTIGYSAFYNCESLTSVTIPNSVKTIRDYAFAYCTSLTSVNIPNSVTTIGEGAFLYCGDLTSVTIPDTVTTIGNGAFFACKSLTSVTMPSSITTIGDMAFKYCTSLTLVTIPNSVKTIGLNAFEFCNSLTSVIIPDSVTKIGDTAFYDCKSLITAYLPDGLEYPEDIFPASTTIYRYRRLLETPQKSIWNGNTATWNAVEDAADYRVQLYSKSTDGSLTAVGEPVSAGNSLYLDMTSLLTANGSGKYSFTVQAFGTEDDTISVLSENSVNNNIYVPSVISVDITWGAMEFTYTDRQWNPETLSYRDGGWMPDSENGNRITVTNNGNSEITFTAEYETVRMDISGSFTDGAAAVSNSSAVAKSESKDIYLQLSGKPDEEMNALSLGSVKIAIDSAAASSSISDGVYTDINSGKLCFVKDSVKINASGFVSDNNGNLYYINPDETVFNGGWKQIVDKLYYFDPTTCVATLGFREIEGKLYYFNDNGALRKTGWFNSYDGKHYYADPSTGEICRGFKEVSGEMNYFDPITGAQWQLTGIQEIDGVLYCFGSNYKIIRNSFYDTNGILCYCDANGKVFRSGWIDLEGKRYYADTATCEIYRGVCEIDGTLYYFDTSTGAMVFTTGLKQIGQKWYYFTENHQIVHDCFYDINGATYYFYADGAMNRTSGLIEIDGKLYGFMDNFQVPKHRFYPIGEITYLFDADGVLCTGLHTMNNNLYYFYPETTAEHQIGERAIKEFIDIDGATYYFGNGGIARTGLCKIDNKYYIFYTADQYGGQMTGQMVKNSFVISDGVMRYCGFDGVVYSGLYVIDGKTYYFYPSEQTEDKGDIPAHKIFERAHNVTLDIAGMKFSFDKNGVGTLLN